MRSCIGLGSAAALCLATLLIAPSAAGAASSAPLRIEIANEAKPATDISARRRVHRHVRHPRNLRRAAPPAYYARPYVYRPDAMTPFFPFYHGYGLDPSW